MPQSVIPATLETIFKFFNFFYLIAITEFYGIPAIPNPPIAIVLPDFISAIAYVTDDHILFILLTFDNDPLNIPIILEIIYLII